MQFEKLENHLKVVGGGINSIADAENGRNAAAKAIK